MKKVKVIADRDVLEFLNIDDLIGKISVEPIDRITNQDQIVTALEHVELLFIIADEDDIKPIAAVAQKVSMDRFCERVEPQYQNVDVKLSVAMLLENSALHVKHYFLRDLDTVTVIPHDHDQAAVIHTLLRAMTDAFNRDDRLIELLKDSQYFTYDIDGLSNDALQYAGDHLEIEGVTLRTPHPIDRETKFSVKVLGVGKKHYVGKMREYIAYEDLNDINTPSDIKRVVNDYDAHCLIIEFDDANFAKAEDIAKVRYSRPFTVFVPTETFVESEWADVTIKVKPEDREALVRDIDRFEIGREDFFDPIGLDMKTATFEIITSEEIDALDARLRNVKQIYVEFECNGYERDNAEAHKIYERLMSKLPEDCDVESMFCYDKSTVGIELRLYMSEYERTSEPRWYE